MLNIIKCPNCGEDVHDQSPACPSCHYKIDVETPADMKTAEPIPPEQDQQQHRN